MMNKNAYLEKADLMRFREITLADGRYMIFYSFDETLSAASADTEKKTDPNPQLEATEERNV